MAIRAEVQMRGELVAVESKAQPPIQVAGQAVWIQRSQSHWGEVGMAWEPVRQFDRACYKAMLLREHQAEARARSTPARKGASRLPEVPDGISVLTRDPS